ncbi:MAG TPA: amidohydrolase family protein [Pseudolabrys sp.]|nr:amidohydrolase family protein [Pseudolabrys sp.]
MKYCPIWGAAFTAAVIGLGAARAQERLEIFDAHLHYNQEPRPFYSLDQVREVFRRNGISGIVATSRPNKGTHELMDAQWPELKVVPFIRPYRVRNDIQTWFNDPAIFELIKSEYARGYYRGIGEFHIYGKSAESDWVRKMVDFSVERNLYLHAHCDEEALLILFRHNPKARIIWAHTGFSVPSARIAELFDQHKDTLWGELSYRSGITGGDGKLSAEWRDLFDRYSDRFLFGSDTWINERWFGYDTIFKEYRRWLAQLPAEQAQRIASGNALRLFAARASN